MLIQSLLKNGGVRIYEKNNSTLLNRYSILQDEGKLKNQTTAKIDGSKIDILGAKRNISILTEQFIKGYKLKIALSKKERIFGVGDATRDCVSLRGISCTIDVENISSYGPQPVLLSTDGWGIIINSTYRQIFDIAKSNKDTIEITVESGNIDFYFVTGNSLKSLIDSITDITGKPIMLPAFGYGLTMVLNDDSDIRDLLNASMLLRDRDIPCDILGLEPGWMETYYDMSVNKCWNKQKFKLPTWHNDSYSGVQSFFYPLREKGMNLSLWLGQDYDLFYEEERKINENVKVDDKKAYDENAEFIDAHLDGARWTDRITERDEPWFNHLKKFVSNGASCFKLDGYTQVLKHPDRFWGMKYHDDEIHNLYPVILAKQMQQGFSEFTNRRAMIYTAGAYLGTQKYAATWAGDTGGGPRPLTSCLNYAMIGHTNTTCDLDISSPASIHYSFLLTWSQLNVWAYWFYPWYLSEKRESMFRDYSRLRSSLFPYIYENAHNASVTGYPVVRPLSLMYEDTDEFDNIKNAFMLGDKLYVAAAFEKQNENVKADYVDSDDFKVADGNIKTIDVTLPNGKWIDYFDGKTYSGKFNYNILENKGGGLFIKDDSILVTMKPQKYIMEKQHEYIINIFGNANDSAFIYEDDGYTYDYKDGKFATTKISSSYSDKTLTLLIDKRQGEFSGRANNGHNIIANSIPKIDGIYPENDITIIIHNKKVTDVTINGKNVEVTFNGKDSLFIVDKSLRKQNITCVIK